ncbi:host cell division inhibitor Icd-like protein [Xenorhabdus bovienii]|nr:host cell division inhibitor Icd-like protein [Xenorhabdus bovienii]MDE1495641.1 host cell division inhibitor Icd-like protein [Xenorhabdus bovienii]MDE9477813.1 host cell division inhibitor Icd-like protein [Xenorhabdus bovienii]MDE9498702.1 host cell division inhibitor Icd-like protein [Xenorhabdus bovienii]MDE9530655.1 host cell division inhibitor Icd-like protein [Xenorhabdus bovienii]
MNAKSYKFLFYAQLRADQESTPERITIKAESLDDARRILAPRYVLTYAGCVPIQN